MQTTEQIKKEIAELEEALRPIARRLSDLRASLAEAESREYIRVNNITRAGVEFSNAPEVRYFGTVYEFGKWIQANSLKAWAEWNGRIYRSSDLILGRMPDSPAIADHL